MARESKAPGIEAVPGFLSRQGIKEAEWQYALHSDFKVIMRPGWTWRARVLACIIRQSRGYRRDLAVMQVGGDTRKDGPTLLPLFPGGIATILKKLAIDAFQEAGVDPDEDARKRFKLDRGNLRDILESLEADDGMIVRARCNGEPRKLIADDLPLDEAVAKNRVVLLAALSQKERKRVSNRLLIYLLPRPKAASLKALNRHDDSFPQVGRKALPPEKENPVQLIFGFMRRQGLHGGEQYAAALAKLPEVRQSIELYQQTLVTAKEQEAAAKEQRKQAEKFMRDVVARVAAKTPPEGAVAQPAADTAQESLFRADQVSSRPSASTGSTKGGDAGHSSLVSQPKRPKTIEELEPIAAILHKWIALYERGKAWKGQPLVFGDTYVKEIFGACRDAVPDCTPEEVGCWTDQRLGIKVGRPVPNPYAYLLAAVPQAFASDAFPPWRAKRQEGQRKESPAAAAACPSCEGSGLIGLKCTSIEETIDAVRTLGAQYCECPEGETTRMLVEPAVMRRSAS